MYTFSEGFYADIRIEDRYSVSISYLNDDLRECTEINVKKAFIRVFDGKMWYYSSTSDLDNIQQALDDLYKNASYNKDISNDKTVKMFETNKYSVLKFQNNKMNNTPLPKKIELLQQGKAHFFGANNMKMLLSIYSDRYSLYEFFSSKGAEIKYDTQYCAVAFKPSFSEGDNNFDDIIGDCTPFFEQLKLTGKDIKEFITDCNLFLRAKDAEKGAFPVILSPMAAGVFAHESFGHKSEADFMLGDENMTTEWALGKKVASKILSIVDTGEDIGRGYVPFDDEGTKARKNYLIKDGILCGRLHSAETAAEFSEGVTGNCRAMNTNYEPIVRMTKTYIEGGESTLEELVGRIEHGYFIKTIKHGSGMSTFTLAPAMAYEIKDGRIGEPVKIAVITGNVFETLSLIDGMSNEIESSKIGFGGCGKMEQYPLNVDMAGPYVSITKMNIQ